MELALFVYLAEVSDSLNTLLFVATFFGAIIYFFYSLYCIAERDEPPKFLATAIVGFVTSAVLCVIIPKKETMYLMAAGYAAQAAATSDEAVKIRRLINTKLDELLKETK